MKPTFCFLILFSALLLVTGPVSYVQAAEYEQSEKTNVGELETDPIGALYNQAMELYKQRRYVQAREKFLQVEAISPEAYPSSKAFLKRIDQHLAQQQADLELQQRTQETLAQQKAHQLAEIKAFKEKQSKDFQHNYRQQKVKEQKTAVAKKKQMEQDLITQAKSHYKNVLALSKAKRYIEAREELQLLRKFLVKHQLPLDVQTDMVHRASLAEEAIEKAEKKGKQLEEQKRTRLAQKEEQRQARLVQMEEKKKTQALQRKQLEDLRTEQALAKERKEAKLREDKEKKLKFAQEQPKTNSEKVVISKEPKEEKFAALLASSPKAPKKDSLKQTLSPSPSVTNAKPVRPQAQERQQLKQKLITEVEELYQEGAELYKAKQWSVARKIFTEVDKLWPNYKSTRQYLQFIDQDSNTEQLDSKGDEDTITSVPSKSRKEIIGEALDAYH